MIQETRSMDDSAIQINNLPIFAKASQESNQTNVSLPFLKPLAQTLKRYCRCGGSRCRRSKNQTGAQTCLGLEYNKNESVKLKKTDCMSLECNCCFHVITFGLDEGEWRKIRKLEFSQHSNLQYISKAGCLSCTLTFLFSISST
ncbi:hypothetical protein RTP6_7699 [Batrachochytrium dendrobatidis]